ncbi:MAG: hypothetical protein ACM358_05510 [Gemmatimonadota bacterium]
MPFYLKPRDIFSDTSAIRSALIVPCRFCPAASCAVREHKPYLQLWRSFLRTPSYEAHIRALKARLESRGISTTVFDSKWPHHFVMCMWPARRRAELSKRVAGYDEAIVLGCDAAVQTVRSALASTECRVVPGMEVEGVMNVTPTVRFPLSVRLELSGVSRVTQN